MSGGYEPPPWAQSPLDTWKLIEIKSGVTIAEHSLQKPCIVLGRAEDQVDIALQHESCSRQHARIAFDANGTPWFRDLASTHGSTINKKRLPAQAIGKTESSSTQKGARGVVLYPGDLLQLGASTRLFCLEGPDKYERGADGKYVPLIIKQPRFPLKASLPQQAPPEEASEDPAAATAHEGGVSWGIDMEDHETRPDSDSSFKLPLNVDVPDKHRKEYERLRALEYKLENIVTESERIRRKGELSQGQERQLERNREKESKFQDEIREREKELYKKLYPDQASKLESSRSSKKASYREEEEEDSDFYDRTKDSDSQSSLQDGETEQSLTTKWKAARQELESLRDDLVEAQQAASRVEHKLAALQASGDEEAFFVQNDLELANDKVKKIQDDMQRLEATMFEAKKLLKVVNPKLTIDEATGYIGVDAVPSIGQSVEPSLMLPPPSRAGGDFVMPPPPVKQTPVPEKSPASATTGLDMPPPPLSTNSSGSFMPPPKRKRVLGPSRPTTMHPSAELSVEPPVTVPPTIQPVSGPSKGTLAMLHATGTGTTASSRSGAQPRTGRDTKAPEKKAPLELDPQHDVFVPPKDQDGSGITKLNAKFAGRY